MFELILVSLDIVTDLQFVQNESSDLSLECVRPNVLIQN